jgi:putative protease
MRKPEIMSPAGYWPQLNAAIEAGADAIYFGLKHFTARAKAGFSLTELPEAMRTLHRRGVRGYITFNTLIFEHELDEAAKTIAKIAEAGADAMIVQDYAAVRMAREIAPDLELHASTQMSIANSDGVRFAQSRGLQRVTLARELSLDEIRKIVEETGCDIEIFVHGALCVAYSGQCFSSEAWGGRSANRGQCAQACRLPYQMMVDGRLQPLDDARYLLSPGDLYALEQVPEIAKIGVAAMKIEGRYKDADYVALATRAYRKAVDDACAGRDVAIAAEEKLRLEQVYSRGLGPFFLTGTNHQAVVGGRAPRHRGVRMGRVARVDADCVSIELSDAHAVAPLKPGDGIVFDAADWRSPQEDEEGGRVYEIAQRGTLAELRFANNAVNFSRIRAGDLVWRTHDPDLDRVVKPYLDPAAPVAKQPVRVHVIAHEGEPLTAEWSVKNLSVKVQSAPLEKAQSRGLSVETLRDQFSRLGNTPYELQDLTLDLQGSPFAPASILNQLRREAVELLQRAAESSTRTAVPYHPKSPRLRPMQAPDRQPQIHILIRTADQLDASIELRPASITLDYLDLYGLRPSIDRIRAAGVEVRIASPRILKPGEDRILNYLKNLDCPLLVRSTGMLDALKGHRIVGDFSLNAANSISAEEYLALGLERITPTHDLNAAQIADLARKTGGAALEAILYQHLPVFHTEHCVFCRFLSTGTSYKDCGRPCEKHRVELKDPNGRAHPVMADIGCRNTVFGAEAQEASAHLDEWLQAGVRHFRLEFVHETSVHVTRVYRAFESAIAGSMTAQQLGAELRKIAPQGTTVGSLFVPRDYQQLPILQ